MATVGTEMSMSLDGFIAGPSGEVGPLFAWDGTGAVTVPMPDPRWTVRTSEASASHLRDGFTRIGVLVAGRRWFDATRGWGRRRSIAQQCLNAGLLEEIVVSLVPVLLGEGIRLFDNLSSAPVELEGPRIIEGTGVTHLHYRVKSR